MEQFSYSVETANNQNKNHTFFELSTIWLGLHKEKIKESTYEKYTYLLQKHIYPVMGEFTLNSLNSAIVNRQLSVIYHKNPDEPLSYSMMKSIIFLVKAIFKYGCKLHYMGEIAIDFDISKKNHKITIIDFAEQEILIDYILKEYTSNNLGIFIALFTGARLGEICALQRKDVDFKNGILHITKTVQRLKQVNKNSINKSKLIVTLPKSNESYRDIPLPDSLVKYMKLCEIYDLHENLYILGQRATPYEPRTLQYGFSSILKKCDLPHYNFHSLRHTFATKCIRLGFDVKTLSEILGHSSVNFTMSQYVHSDMEHKKAQMHLLG